MGHPQLWLLGMLLLCGEAFMENHGPENKSPVCSKDSTRFKHLRKYVYTYDAETTSGVAGTADSRSGSHIHCKVDLEVPHLCNLIMKTSQCTLREVSGVGLDGKALLKRTKDSNEFAAAMSQYELKFKIQDERSIELYPEENEATHILNIKRGIISALLVPMETDVNIQSISMDTVYGKCDSSIEIKSRKSNTATSSDIEITRNLKSCDRFNPIRDYVSPIAFIKGLNMPLSTLISSNQHCHYTVDPRKKHISEAVCTEKHLLLPSSYKNQYGMMAKVTQTLKLEETTQINNRNMDVAGLIKKELSLEGVETKTPRHGDAVLKALQELQKLSVSQQNHKRANLFYKLVTGLRSLHNSTLGPLVPKLMETSSFITIQALAQCGTPECFGAILQILRTSDIDPMVADVVTYSLGLLSSPTAETIREILNMAQYHSSRASFYALSHAVNKFYLKKGITEEIKDVANFMTSLISSECSGNDPELTYLTLRAIGNMGPVLENVNPRVKHSLKACIKSNIASPEVQKAAIQALRKMTLNDEDHGVLLRVFQETSSPTDKRLAAYLMLMKNPSSSDLSKVIKVLLRDKNAQVKSFVASHFANVLDSTDSYNEPIKIKVQEAFKELQMPIKDFRRFSRNYQVSKTLTVPWSDDPFSAKIEGNLLFDSSNYIAKEAMLKTTVEMFGLGPQDIFEIGLDGKNLEPTIEALFGPEGFFPDSATKALYWIDGKVPEKFSKALFEYFGYSKDGKQDQDFMNGIILNFEKLVKGLSRKEVPEVKAYLRVFQEELGYLKLSDFKLLGKLVLKSFKALQTVPQKIAQAISQEVKNDLMLHYIFMDNKFELPTGSGLQLQVALSGVATPGAKLGLKFSQRNMQAELIVKPSVAVEFITHLGVNIPEFARNGVQMTTNIYHESGIEANVALKAGQFKLIIPVPKTPTKLFSISNALYVVSGTRTEQIPPLIENRVSQASCSPFSSGFYLCTRLEYSNASSTNAAPYYPLTGESRFEIELQPTGKVKEYAASVTYELVKEGKDVVDTLKLVAQAEGLKKEEAKLIFTYNRDKTILTSDFQVPNLFIDVGTSFRMTDSSTPEKRAYAFVLDVLNNQSPEITITGKLGYAGGRESSMGASISIPRLQTQAKTDASILQSNNGMILQIDSSATTHGSSVSQRVVVRNNKEKVEVQWNSGASAALKRISAPLLVDFTGYSKALQKRAGELLDHKVPNTDMTVRHIISHFIVATNTWLQKASQGIPYAKNIQDELSRLQKVDFQNMDLITIPEELFLKSDGQIKYIWNKESVVITLPVPFGGRSSYDMRVPKTIRAPSLVMESLGVNMPSREYKLPQFTIPETYTLRLPLLGTFEITSNVYNNFYNWSGSYMLANTTRDSYSLRTRYFMKADSVLDLFSYNMQGLAEGSYDTNSFTCICENSFHHKLLSSNFRYSKVENFGLNDISVKNILALETTSPLGVKLSFSMNQDLKELEKSYVANQILEGQLNVATAFAKAKYTELYTLEKNSLKITVESDLQFDSSLFQATNQMTGRYTADSWIINSVSNIANGFLTNRASLRFENSQLKLSSETNGNHKNLAALNKFDLTLDKQQAILRSELKANYLESKYYALVSGSINNRGVELISDLSWNNKRNKAEHKSALSIKQDGLVSSATTKLQFLFLVLQNEVNAHIGTSGASVKIDTNGRSGIHNAKFSLDGKVALTEIALLSTYQGSILNVDSKNILNFRMNKGDLRFSNSLTGSYKEMKFEHTHELNTVGLTLNYASDLDHTISSDISHKHHVDLQLRPYSLTANLNNDLKYTRANINNKARLQLEPLKVNLDGNMKGIYSNNEIKHIYTFTYADLAAHLKTDTTANIQGAALTHKVNLNIAGLSASIIVNTNCDSEMLTFSNEMRSVAAPFTVTIDMHTNGDGQLSVMGTQSGRLFNKFLFKAEPLAFVLSHEYKGSTAHYINSVERYGTLLDSKANVVFTPSEQRSLWKIKSKLNNHIYTQEFNAFNTAENIGVELSGQTLVDPSALDFPINIPFTSYERVNLIDILDLRESIAQPQEFGLSLSVKYDKNADVHIINLPFLESLPAYYEQLRHSIITALKSIQKNLKNVNIEQFMRKLDKFSQQMNDYVNSVDLEAKMNNLKEELDAFMNDYSITVDDLQNVLENAKANLQKALVQLQALLTEVENYMLENYDFRAAIVQLVEQIVEKIKVLDQQYEISVKMVNTIQQLQSIISQFDASQIENNVATFIENMDVKYKIRAQMQEKLDQLQSQIQNIDAQHIANILKQQIETINFGILIEKLKTHFPLEKINQILEQIKEILLNAMEDYEVLEKINVLRNHMHELIVNNNIDQQAKVFIDKMIELSKQQKIRETIQQLTITLKKIDIKSFLNQVLKFIDDAVKQLQTFDYKKMVDGINDFLDTVVKKLKTFDYNKFVDETNNKIREATQKINDEIRSLELPQKIEAAKQYIKDASIVVAQYIEKLKDTRLAVIVNWLNNLLSSTAIDTLKVNLRDLLEDIRRRIYQMDIQRECQRYLQKASQLYSNIISYLVDQWNIASKKISSLAEQYNVKHIADGLNQFVETGISIPEIRIGIINIPAFEVSLRSLREATFQTPDFIIPLTDLYVPSYQINFKKLNEIRIPARFTTPEFTILNTIKVPSFTIDFNEIKLKIVRTIDQIISSDFQLPATDMYFQEVKIRDFSFSDFPLPEMNLPELQIPELLIPKLNLNEFQFPDIRIPDFQLPRIPHTITVPLFGKLSGSFRIASPFFTMTTNTGFQNVTVYAQSPEFVASVSVVTVSKMDYLAFTIIANTHLLAPEMKKLILKENLKITNSYLNVVHAGEVIFLATSVLSNAETTATFRTTGNAMELHNKLKVNLHKTISAESKTTYTHRLNVPNALFTGQAELSNEIKTAMEAGHISFTSIGKGNWKWSAYDYSDEGTHESKVSFTVQGPVAAFIAENKINAKHLKVNQRLVYEYNLPGFSQLQIESVMEFPQLGRSVLNVQGIGNLEQLKMELQGTHEAKMNGRITGTINNDVSLLVHPFEIKTSTNNNVNLKVILPLKIMVKFEFLNNYGLVLNPSTQQVGWVAKGRFNQYRYAHNISAGNNEDRIEAALSMNGDADLEFLNIPLSFPKQTVPYLGIQIPQVEEYSLWEDTGLKKLLKTPEQSFDLNLKAQYKKSKYMHSFHIPLDGVHKTLNYYAMNFNKNFEKGRDKTLTFLTESYNQAKTKFDKYKVATSVSQSPQIFKIPGYTIPVLNIEVSPFTAELPAFAYVIPKEMSTPSFSVPLVGFSMPSYTVVLPSLELPVLHIPHGLRTLKLPNYRVSPMPSKIHIPALGNITIDFSFKSSVITLNTNAGVFNQHDTVARLSSSSSSVIDALQYQLDATTSLTRKRGLKLATALFMQNKFIGGNHDSTISFTKKNIEASVITTAKITIPSVKVNFGQELKGNTKTTPIIASTINVSYDIDTNGISAKGAVVHKTNLESILSYVSADISTNGFINGRFPKGTPFSGKLIQEANAYLNAKGIRSAIKFEAISLVEEVWNVVAKENIALEVSSQRLYAVWDHSGENSLYIPPLLETNGNQICKVTLELSSDVVSAALQVQIAQPNNIIGKTSAKQAFSLTIHNENQKIDWQGESQIISLFLGHDLQLANDKTKVLVDLSGSLGGHLIFLRRFVLPIYERSLWHILKLDLTSRPEEIQYLNVSTHMTYTKNEDGYFIPINVKKLEDGFTITIPEIHLSGQSSVITTPAFSVPFTTLGVPSYTIDLHEVKIPERLTTQSFDISLPSVPKIQFPQIDVVTKYINQEEHKIPYFELTVPEYLLTVSEFTLPKTLSLGNMLVDLNDVANKIADFDLPTITIPQQQIEIPGFKTALPAGIYFPKFGALSSSFKISSPLYSTTWKADLKNRNGTLEHFLDLTASSPLQFLEYDLEGVSTYAYEGNRFTLNTQYDLAHPDLSAKYKSAFIAKVDRIVSNTASLDITSPTFTDVQMHYQGDGSRAATLISSSSTGTLGILTTLDTNILNSKIFYRTQSNPQDEVDIVKSEISFKNPEWIQIKTNWKEGVATELFYGLKEKVPKMSGALYKALNKYHREHTGMEISTAASELKEALEDHVNRTYRNALNSISEVEQQLHEITNQVTWKYERVKKESKRLYHEAADQAAQIDYNRITVRFLEIIMDAVVDYHERIKHLIDSAIEFLKVTRFQVPGLPGKHTGEELYVMATEKVAKAVDLSLTRVQEHFEALIASVNEIEIKIPASDQIIKGSYILDEMKTFLSHVQKKVHQIFVGLQKIDFAKHLTDLKIRIQQVFQKVEQLIRNVQAENYEYLKDEAKQLLANFFQALNSLAGDVKYWSPRVENFIRNSMSSIYDKLGDFLQSLKDLRKEYFDPSVVGWSVKYYEVEEKFVTWLKNLFNALLEWHTKFTNEAANLIITLTDEATEFLENEEKFAEVSKTAHERISYWSEVAKQRIAEQNKQVKAILQETYNHLSNSYGILISEAKRLVDLTIDNYAAFFQYLQKLLDWFEKVTADALRPYVAVRPGELRIDIPKPFDLPAFKPIYQVPQLNEDLPKRQTSLARH